MKRVALRTLLSVALTCALCAHAHAANYSFDYAVSGAPAFGIDRVFDDGKDTVLRFYAPLREADKPTVTAADGTPLQTRVIGPYLVLPGIQRHVLLYRKGIVAQVHQGRPDMPYPVPGVAQPATAPGVVATTASPAAPATTVPGGEVVQPQTTARIAPVVVTSSVAGVQTSRAVIGAPTEAAPVASASGLTVISDELPPLPTWEAKADATLRSTTEAWAKQAGWSVRWLLSNGDDYQVDPHTFSGEFTEALAKLYVPYFRPSFNGDKPLRVKAYSLSKIIVVSE
ncbi:TcpQ domain-containing protein [Stenotrophomonas indicatrix]|uniref:TcpQ domain-containing protein n=1 Tax=Stenotrophomonas indicatrix TaxID=2045451 RepID=UPI003008BB14